MPSAPSFFLTAFLSLSHSPSAQTIDFYGANLPKYASELAASALPTFAWGGACPSDAVVCSSPTIITGGLRCTVTVSNDLLDRCELSAQISRFSSQSASAVVAIAVKPLDFVATANSILIGSPQVLLLNLSRSVTLTATEKASSFASFIATGAGCSWSANSVPVTFDSSGRVNVSILVGAGNSAGCAVAGQFSLFQISGQPVQIGTTSLGSAPVSAPADPSPLAAPISVPVATPAASPVAAPVQPSPVASSPIAAPSNGSAPGANAPASSSPSTPTASNSTESEDIYIVITGRSPPTDLHLDQVASGVAAVLNLSSSDVDAVVLGGKRRAIFNYTVEIEFLTAAALAARTALVNSTELQLRVVDSVFNATQGLYSGVSYQQDFVRTPVSSPSVVVSGPVANNTDVAPSDLVGGIPGGAIAGGVLAGFAGLVILIFIIYVVVKGRRSKNPKSASAAVRADEPATGSTSAAKKDRSKLVDSTLLIDKNALIEMETVERARQQQRERDREEDERDSSPSTSSGNPDAKAAPLDDSDESSSPSSSLISSSNDSSEVSREPPKKGRKGKHQSKKLTEVSESSSTSDS